jgi:chromosome segregation ATPase
MFLRNLIFTIVLVALIVGGFGYYRGWFGVATHSDDNKSNLNVSINKDKVQADEERAKQALHKLENKIKGKSEEAGGNNEVAKSPEGFHAEIDRQLKAIDAKIGDVQARIGRLNTPKKEELSRDMENLNQKRREVGRKLEELGTATGKAAEDLRATIAADLKEMHREFDKITAQVEK